MRDVPSPELTAIALLWLMSLSGVLLSAFLTVAKFRSTFRCDESLLSACGTMFECGRVLTSSRSLLLGVPISIFSASYYAVLLGLATMVLLRPARNLTIVGALLSWLVLTGAAVVSYYAFTAIVSLRSSCGYCVAIYAIQLVLLLTVSLMHPGGYFASLVAVWAQLRARGGVALIAGLGFVALSSTQMVLYRNGSNSMRVDPRCVVQGRGLPETVLRTPATAPEVEIGLFVDLACPSCRTEFLSWMDDAEASGGRYQVSVYHYAREGDCVPRNFSATSPDSVNNHSCDAAVAVECAAKLVAEREPDGDRRPAVAAAARLRVMGLVVDLPRKSEPHFAQMRLAEAARALGLEVDATDRAGDPFMRCLEDPASRESIREHARFGMTQNLLETPGIFLLFFDGAIPSDRMLLFRGAKTFGDLDEAMRKFRHQLEERG